MGQFPSYNKCKDYHREQKNMVATVTVATVATIAAVGL